MLLLIIITRLRPREIPGSMIPSRLATTPRPRLQQLTQQLSPRSPSSRINALSPSRPFATMTDHSKWKFNHTMLRIKDPKKSIDYYKLLGLSVISEVKFPDAKFDLYFLGMPDNPHS